MELFNKLNYPVFLLAFSIGIFIVYITKPRQKIVIKYPTPNEIMPDYQYQDDADNCYKYMAEKVECTGKEKQIPIQ